MKKVFFEIRRGFLSGKISGAQVTIGAINWGLIMGAVDTIIGAAFSLLGSFYPSTAPWSYIITIISLGPSIAGLIHLFLRIKGKLKISAPSP